MTDVREQYTRALSDPSERRFLVLYLEELVPNIKYLREIGRLPEELGNFEPEKEFVLKE